MPCCQTLRLQQSSAAATHWLGITMPCPPSIMPAKAWTESMGWLIGKRSRSPLENILVTSDPERFEPLPFASFDELKVPLSDCRTSELWEPVAWENCPSPVLISSVPLFSLFFVFKKRPPHPLGRRIAWRWRDSCIYGCKTNTKSKYYTTWLVSCICIFMQKKINFHEENEHIGIN